MSDAPELAERVALVRARIAAACARAGRQPDEVTLVAASKTVAPERVAAAHAAGVRDFGENYAQELRAKQVACAALDARWHFIGRLQRNKAKEVAGRVVLVHSVDDAALASALGRRAAAAGLVQQVLLEVNLGDEASKAGVAIGDAERSAELVCAVDGVRVVGLMALPPPSATAEGNRGHFRALAGLAARLGLRELSMGTTDDFEVAVEEGATLVRVGTAIFGARR